MYFGLTRKGNLTQRWSGQGRGFGQCEKRAESAADLSASQNPRGVPGGDESAAQKISSEKREGRLVPRDNAEIHILKKELSKKKTSSENERR